MTVVPTSPPKHQAGPPRKPGAAPTAKHAPYRDSASARGYGYRWRQASQGYLLRHRLCVHCLAVGRTSLATVVDHITPHCGDSELFWEASTNWQALCVPCHNRATAKYDGGFGNARKEGKPGTK